MTETSLPRVGVVMLNWNRWSDTIECLESLFRLDYGPINVVLCDQGSTDGSLKRIREWAAGTSVPAIQVNPQLAHLSSPPVPKPIRVLELSRAAAASGGRVDLSAQLILVDNGDNVGSAAGNNIGLAILFAQPEVKYAWILNNDIVVDSASLRELVRCAESDARIGAVGGKLMDYRDPTLVQAAGGGKLEPWRGFPRAVENVKTRKHADGDAGPDLDWVTGGNMLSPVTALRQVGAIDEEYYFYMEDVDHSIRLGLAGFRFGYAPDSLVWHKGGATVGYTSPRYDYYMVRNSLAVARKYHPRMMPFVLAYTIYRVVLPKIARGQWARLRTVGRAYNDYRKGIMGRAEF